MDRSRTVNKQNVDHSRTINEQNVDRSRTVNEQGFTLRKSFDPNMKKNVKKAKQFARKAKSVKFRLRHRDTFIRYMLFNIFHFQ